MLTTSKGITIGRDTHFIIDTPENITAVYKRQMLDLVDIGGQVKRERAEPGIENAQVIGLTIYKAQVIATCCLKNPLYEYKQQVFIKAQATRSPDLYNTELGYITTHSDFEGEKYCQQLLKEFFFKISHMSMFATTRKPAMKHVLEKYGFYQLGVRYGDQLDLELMLYEGAFG
jgi:predicted GNAT family N-acyltransferase